MSWIGEFVSNVKVQAKAKAEIEDAFLRAIDDGVLNEDEIAEIEAKRMEWNIDEKTSIKLKNRFYALALKNTTQDRRLSPDEDAMLTKLSAHFNVSDKDKIRSYKDLARFKLLHSIELGELPVVNASGLSLQKNEQVHWVQSSSMLEEKTKRQYIGGSRGVSVRIAKGVSFRTGGFRGHVETSQEIVPVSAGELIITNKRIVFRGDRKNFTSTWAKIIDLELFGNGIRIGKEGQQKPGLFQFNNGEDAEIVGMICSNIINSAN